MLDGIKKGANIVNKQKRINDPVCPFSWYSWNQFDTAGFTFDNVKFTEDFGAITEGATFPAVSVNFETGQMDCYRVDRKSPTGDLAIALTITFKLVPIENARLMSAYRELLTVLNLLMADSGHFYQCLAGQRGRPIDDTEYSDCSRVCRLARAALRKATGVGRIEP